MKNYRIIYNQDCTNLFHITREPITPSHVDTMVDEVAESGADLLLINPLAQRTNYPSKVWQTFWDGYSPGNPAFFGLVSSLESTDAELKAREAWVVQMKRLADHGCDYLAQALARCREKGIAPGVSIRMNDMHDAPNPGTHLFSRFYMEHPELHLDNGPACGWGAAGLNYEHRAVRDHYLALVRELVRDYDFDVLELDFLRFHCYFPRTDFARHCATMTDFVREVRGLLETTGKRISLLARVAATPSSAYELGFDVAMWAREKLVDGISAGAFLNTQWGVAIAEYRSLIGNDVALFASADYTADRRSGLPIRMMPTEPELLRGFTAGHLAAGADGVELFNFFCPREELNEPVRHEPSFATIRELREMASLRGAPKTYTLMSGWAVAETDGIVQVPTTLGAGEARSFHMLLAAESEGTVVQAIVLFSGAGATTPERLWLHVNVMPVGPARAITSCPEPAKNICQASFDVPPSALRDGTNELALRNEGDTITIVSIDVSIHA